MIREFRFLTQILENLELNANLIKSICVKRVDVNLFAVKAYREESDYPILGGQVSDRNFWYVATGNKIKKFEKGHVNRFHFRSAKKVTKSVQPIGAQLLTVSEDIHTIVEVNWHGNYRGAAKFSVVIYKMHDFDWRDHCRQIYAQAKEETPEQVNKVKWRKEIKTGTIKHLRLDPVRNPRGTGVIEPDEPNESGKPTLFMFHSRTMVSEDHDNSMCFDFCSRAFVGKNDGRLPKIGDRIVYYESYSGRDSCYLTMSWCFADEWEAAEREILERPQGAWDYRCRAVTLDKKKEILWEGWLHEWNEFFKLPRKQRPAFMETVQGWVHFKTLRGWDNSMGGHRDYNPELR